MKSSSSKQVMTETSPTMMMVDMNVVIVVMITSSATCLKSSKYYLFVFKHLPVQLIPAPHTLSVGSVSVMCLILTKASLVQWLLNTEALCLEENFYVWLSEVWLRFEGILSSRGKTVNSVREGSKKEKLLEFST